MFILIMTIILITNIIVVYNTIWGEHKRETARKAGEDKRVGRHRATNRPTMTWRI